MRKGYKIGLFFVCIMIMVLVAVLVWKRHTMSGFPNENAQNSDDMNKKAGARNWEAQQDQQNEMYPQDLQAQSINMVTTCDTICVY